jgi:ribosomal protein L11 methyltransferase
MAHVVTVELSSVPAQDQWQQCSLLAFDSGALGIDEGEVSPPEGLNALTSGHHPNDADEFLEAISPGVLLPPRRFTVYFSTEVERQTFCEAITNLLTDFNPQFEFSEVSDQIDYSESWRRSFRPIFAAPLWLVCASWHSDSDKRAAIPADLGLGLDELQTIMIEPGMAFGTGTHETTRSCLTLLSDAINQRQRGAVVTVLDFGCGSGILAIAAKLTERVVQGLSVAVTAVDIDPLSLDATAANAARNQITVDAILPSVSIDGLIRPAKQSTEQSKNKSRDACGFDLILANVLKGTLLDYMPAFRRWIAPGGHIILSGLLSEQVQDIISAAENHGFHLCRRLDENEWSSLLLVLGQPY